MNDKPTISYGVYGAYFDDRPRYEDDWTRKPRKEFNQRNPENPATKVQRTLARHWLMARFETVN